MALPHYRRDDEDDGREAQGATMGFLEHLDELRSRLIKACIALAVGMVVSYIFSDRIAEIVLEPMLLGLPQGASLITTRPGEGFAFFLDLSLMGGVILAAPFVSWQAWRFIAPGLYRNEKKLIVPFLVLAVGGSIAGALFSHEVLFPGVMAFFRAFDSPRMRFMPRVEDTFALYKNTLIGMVIVFQIPTLVYVLARMRIVTAGFLWRHLNYAILIGVIAAAVLTPSPDPWNQLMFAAPMIGMYILGIGIAWLVQPKAEPDTGGSRDSALTVVFAATVFEQARRQRDAARATRARR